MKTAEEYAEAARKTSHPDDLVFATLAVAAATLELAEAHRERNLMLQESNELARRSTEAYERQLHAIEALGAGPGGVKECNAT